MPIDPSTLPSPPVTGNQYHQPLLGANELGGDVVTIAGLGRQPGEVLAGPVNEGLGRQSCWQRLIASITSIVRRFTQAIGL